MFYIFGYPFLRNHRFLIILINEAAKNDLCHDIVQHNITLLELGSDSAEEKNSSKSKIQKANLKKQK